MHRLAMALGALLLCAGAPSAVSARPSDPASSDDGDSYKLTADSIEFEKSRELYIAQGNVTIRQGDRSLRADWMAFSDLTQRGVASGNIIFVSGSDTLYTDFVHFNIDSLQGILFDAQFADVEGQFRLSGAEIAKTGEDTYRFKDGTFTTCRCPDADGREPWQIEAEEADLEIEGYATAKNTTFEVLGVPVVWLPWMIYPLKTERSSGFLLPKLKLSSLRGAEVALPFFWAARENVNVTATPRWSGKRGWKGNLDIEYLQGERSGGEVAGAYAYDEDINPNSVEDPYDRNRWFALALQDQHLPGDVRLKTDITVVSDNDYILDFDDVRPRRADRFLDSTAFAERGFLPDGQLGLVGSVVYTDDLQSPDDLDRDKYIQQRLPELAFVDLPAPLPWSWSRHIVPSLDVDYIYFTHMEDPVKKLGADNLSANGLFLDTGIDAQPNTENGVPYERNTETGLPDVGDPSNDDFTTNGGPEGNGVFDEGEPLRDKGHRMVLHPRVAVPFRIADVVEVYPEAGWSQTLYQTQERDFKERGFATALVDMRTRLRRGFGENVTHVLEPHLAYAYLMDTSQSDNPLFIPPTQVAQMRLRQLDLRNVLSDPSDRIPEFNGITLGFGNQFWRNRKNGEADRLLADFTLSAAYDFAKSSFGWVILDGQTYPWTGTRARFVAGVDPEEGTFESGWLAFDWRSVHGHGIGITYRYLRNIPQFFEDFTFADDRFDNFEDGFERVNQIGANLRFLLFERWRISYRIAYSFEQSLLLGNRGALEYISRCNCWSAGIEIAQSRSSGVEFALLYRLLGLGQEFAGGSTGLDFLDAN